MLKKDAFITEILKLYLLSLTYITSILVTVSNKFFPNPPLGSWNGDFYPVKTPAESRPWRA